MKRELNLGGGMLLPESAVTETFGLLAARGSGKTNTARVMAEEMFAAGLPFVVVDPVGSWYGLRSSRDGNGPGLELPIFGGKHGDVRLERGGGQLIADLIVDDRMSCILDLSSFDSEGSKKAFLLDFARRLYQRNEEPLHLFLEEADDYIPQRPMRDEAQLLRAWENIVRRGRGRGLGMTLITQRSASLNKNVLTQVQTLIAMRTTGPQDRAAIADWLKYHDQSQEILESLPKLESGEAWVWSPQFLKTTTRVRFRLSRTYDSGATPRMAKKGRAPVTLADVDLASIRERMAETIEREKAEDPKELRAQVAALQRELAEANKNQPVPKVERVEVPILKDAHLARLEKSIERLTGAGTAVVQVGQELATAVRAVRNGHAATPQRPAPTAQARPVRQPAPRQAATGAALPSGEARILTAIAQYVDGVTREQLTILTGYKRSTRDAYVQRLRERELVQAVHDRVLATDAGLEALGDYEPLPIGDALRAYWLDRLPEGERRVLQAVTEAHPQPVSRDAISETTGYKRSTRDAYLQRLRTRRLVETDGGAVRAAEELFA